MSKTGYMKMNRDTGEGDITLPKDWDEHDELFRADVALDWLHQILKEYNNARVECGWDRVEVVSERGK